jgi:hypothetical protein
MPTPKPTLEQIARDILADCWDSLPDGDYSYTSEREWQFTAQAYLDNLAEGCDDPEDLNALIAEGLARPSYDTALANFSDRHGSADYKDFSEWFDEGYYTARAAMSYVPAVSA